MVHTSAEEQTWRMFLAARAAHGGWKGGAAGRLLTCDSLASLQDRLTDPDANTRIIAVRALAAQAIELDAAARATVVAAIRPLVHDWAANEVGHADFDCETDEPAVHVAHAALAALEILDPDWTPPRK